MRSRECPVDAAVVTRSARWSRGATAVAAASVIAADFPLGHGPAAPVLGALAVLVLVAAVALRDARVLQVALLAALLAAPHLAPVRVPWPVNLVFAVGAYVLLCARVPALRTPDGWLRRGALDRTLVPWIAAVVAVASVALVGWVALLHPDVRDVRAFLPPVHPVLLVIGGVVVFPVANAIIEEVIFRGVILGALEFAWGRGRAPYVAQAAAFGLAHWHGFPRGVVGVAMALVYGLMLGELRRRSRGLLAPVVAHVFADATIFALVYVLLLR
jgi:membrane protease YdiL (CAAX protease family)